LHQVNIDFFIYKISIIFFIKYLRLRCTDSRYWLKNRRKVLEGCANAIPTTKNYALGLLNKRKRRGQPDKVHCLSLTLGRTPFWSHRSQRQVSLIFVSI